MKNRLLIEAIAVVVAFLVGFLPQYIKTRRLEGELHALQQGKANAELRDLVDKITAELVKGDLGVIGDLQDVFARTRRATLPAGEQ